MFPVLPKVLLKTYRSKLLNISALICNNYSSLVCRPLFCVVGSGPSGFYTAQGLLKEFPGAVVDVYEKFPFPFGLIRYGVAPDHPDVKNCIQMFNKIAARDGFSFMGNVHVGKDITVDQLQSAYHAVVLCTGADDDRCLNIPGEDLKGIVSARSFVGWYNGHPHHANLDVNLDVETVAVLGHGNVAIDVTRILLTPVDVLRRTDITEHSLEALSRSRVKRVCLFGRRGPLQVAFTTKEFREMVNLKNCRKIIRFPSSVDTSLNVLQGLQRARRRLIDLVLKHSNSEAEEAVVAPREWEMKFFRTPTQFLPDSDGTRLSAVRFSINQIVDEKLICSDETEDFECQLLLRSIGYRGMPLDASVPFNTTAGVVPNKWGRVIQRPGLYCGGWIATGTIGVIAYTSENAYLLSQTILTDVKKGHLDVSQKKDGKAAIDHILKEKKIQVVSYEDWYKINQEEVSRGKKLNKPREKLANIEEALRLVRCN